MKRRKLETTIVGMQDITAEIARLKKEYKKENKDIRIELVESASLEYCFYLEVWEVR